MGTSYAKKTWYNGQWYDSGAEAKCAESLDVLGFKWQYAKVSYRFGGGTQYTPDFVLDCGIVIEVKGTWDSRAEFDAIKFLSTSSDDYFVCDGDGELTLCELRDGQLVKWSLYYDRTAKRFTTTWAPGLYSNLFAAAGLITGHPSQRKC